MILEKLGIHMRKNEARCVYCTSKSTEIKNLKVRLKTMKILEENWKSW